MKKQIILIFFISIVWIPVLVSLRAQSLPVGFPLIEEGLRRGQLLGTVDSLLSFNIRSLNHIEALQQNKPSFTFGSVLRKSENEQFNVQLLPISNQTEYTSNIPYQTNNGLMLPIAGFQSSLSAGVYAKLGILSLQLYPTLYYGMNREVDGYSNINKTDWGQSQIAVSYKLFTLALSNQNMWWGPSKNNALILSNNAAGFKHISFKSSRPVNIFIGHLEWELVGGRLDNSLYTSHYPTQGYTSIPFLGPANQDARYMNGISISYQPKWVPGLFLGINRAVQMYRQTAIDYKAYLPVFGELFRGGGDDVGTDGQISITTRYMMPAARAELYFEYGRNDAAGSIRDFALIPQHSRAYVFGITKIVETQKEHKFISMEFEMIQMEQTIDRLVRGAGSWYVHGQVHQGFTQMGEVLGAGVGPSGNQQDFKILLINQETQLKYGFSLRRVVHNNDFLYVAFGDLDERKRYWTDLSMGLEAGGFYKRFIFEGQLTYIYSLNYQWELLNELNGSLTQGNNQSNVFLGIKTAYQF